MKTRKVCLAVILCAFCAAYVLLWVHPVPATLASTVHCNVNHPSCYVPVPVIGRLMP